MNTTLLHRHITILYLTKDCLSVQATPWIFKWAGLANSGQILYSSNSKYRKICLEGYKKFFQRPKPLQELQLCILRRFLDDACVEVKCNSTMLCIALGPLSTHFERVSSRVCLYMKKLKFGLCHP